MEFLEELADAQIDELLPVYEPLRAVLDYLVVGHGLLVGCLVRLDLLVRLVFALAALRLLAEADALLALRLRDGHLARLALLGNGRLKAAYVHICFSQAATLHLEPVDREVSVATLDFDFACTEQVAGDLVEARLQLRPLARTRGSLRAAAGIIARRCQPLVRWAQVVDVQLRDMPLPEGDDAVEGVVTVDEAAELVARDPLVFDLLMDRQAAVEHAEDF